MTVKDDERSATAPRILIEHSDHWLINMGDLAMMDVTLSRVRRLCPAARIGVMTEAPHLLRAYFPDAEPINPTGRSSWGAPGALDRLAARAGPARIGPLDVGWITFRAWFPPKVKGALSRGLELLAGLSTRPRFGWMDRAAGAKGQGGPGPEADPAQKSRVQLPPNTLRAVQSASFVLAMGGGYITDADQTQSVRVLTLLEHAQSLGIPTAMVGQGLGPAEGPWLQSRLAAVLPQVGFIGLREGRQGPDILRRAGVPPTHFRVTGDDAIELAYSVRTDTIGSDIGICLRASGYSPVSPTAHGALARTLDASAQHFRAGLVPVLISDYRSEDRRSTLPLLDGSRAARRPLGRFARPQDVARQVGTCRVLVTGAYHAAVFALTQGIPVIALSTSRYYDDKFLGLADMFGTGLELVDTETEDLEHRLSTAIREAWERVPRIRTALRTAAEHQIAASKHGFGQAFGAA
jgi:polysaccharide pyruvyl transferase WcaK-like protein